MMIIITGFSSTACTQILRFCIWFYWQLVLCTWAFLWSSMWKKYAHPETFKIWIENVPLIPRIRSHGHLFFKPISSSVYEHRLQHPQVTQTTITKLFLLWAPAEHPSIRTQKRSRTRLWKCWKYFSSLFFPPLSMEAALLKCEPATLGNLWTFH